MSIKPIVITFGFVALAFSPRPGQAAQDRCAELDSHGHPRHCSPVGEGLAPVWDDTACCRGSDCTPPDAQGQCSSGRTAFWCEFAELDIGGALTCLFEVPDLCSVTDCPLGYDDGEGGVEPLILCCPWDDFEACFEYHPGAGCDTIWYCDWGASNPDGTYSCYEPEPW
jgi:hypothetical protein